MQKNSFIFASLIYKSLRMGLRQKEESPNNSLHNTLATGTTVKGDMFTEIDFRTDGKIEGNIECKGKIVIGPKGLVTGNIVATNAEILGEVDGSVQVKEKLILKSTSMIKGDILTQTLEIEPNAKFNGSCKMANQTEAPAAKK